MQLQGKLCVVTRGCELVTRGCGLGTRECELANDQQRAQGYEVQPSDRTLGATAGVEQSRLFRAWNGRVKNPGCLLFGGSPEGPLLELLFYYLVIALRLNYFKDSDI